MRRHQRGNQVFIGHLEQSSFFAKCTRRELREIASLCTPVDIDAGRVLTKQADLGSECFVVLNGHAVVERNGVMVGTVSAGSIVGEIALLRGMPRTATVTAATPMSLVVINRSELATMRRLGIATAMWNDVDELVTHRMATVVPVVKPTVSDIEREPIAY